MRKPKVHMTDHVEWDDGDVLYIDVVCGMAWPTFQESAGFWKDVTCKRCLAKREHEREDSRDD